MKKPIYFVLATGRDGSLSSAKAMQKIAKMTHMEHTAIHEYKHLDIYDLICSNPTSVYPEIALDFLNDIRKNKIIPVGAGYPLLMPYLPRSILQELRVLMLRRPFDNWLPSMKMMSEKWGHNSGNYLLNESKFMVKHYRPAAFHFSEMLESDWKSLSLDQKLRWYYDKHSNSVKEVCHLFEYYSILETEVISTNIGLQKYCDLLDCSVPADCLPEHLNSSAVLNHPDINVARFLKDFDPSKATHDLKYLINFSINKVESGYLNRDIFMHSQVNKLELEEICLALEDGLKRLKNYI